jgi:hypothetical protein
MEAFVPNADATHENSGGVDITVDDFKSEGSFSRGAGSSIIESDLEQVLGRVSGFLDQIPGFVDEEIPRFVNETIPQFIDQIPRFTDQSSSADPFDLSGVSIDGEGEGGEPPEDTGNDSSIVDDFNQPDLEGDSSQVEDDGIESIETQTSESSSPQREEGTTVSAQGDDTQPETSEAGDDGVENPIESQDSESQNQVEDNGSGDEGTSDQEVNQEDTTAFDVVEGEESGEEIVSSEEELPADSPQDIEDAGEADAGNTQSVDPATLEGVRTVNPDNVEVRENLAESLGDNGDLLDGGSGVNTVVGAGGSDVIFGNGDGAFNTIATGGGGDVVVLGANSTNRIFDFDPAVDQFGLTGDIPTEQIGFGQGTNPQNGGLNQPLDSRNNAVVFNTSDNNILAALTFTGADELSDSNFVRVSPDELEALTSGSTTSLAQT